MSKIKPGSRIGPFPYRIVKSLGNNSGNMSEVWLANVGEPDAAGVVSQVVVKISKSESEHQDFFEDTIFNESERLRKLDQRGVVRILPIQTENRMRQEPYAGRASSLPGNPWFLVLEFLGGGSLAEVLEANKQLDVSLALEIIRKLAETLEYLHYNDIVHLDIKPENILFRRPLSTAKRVEPVLIDFGIARNTGQAGLEGRTLHYAPPERVLSNRGNAPPETLPRPNPSMDIYSMGVVLYQMLAGRRPFEGRTSKSISSAIIEGKPTRPSKYSNLVWPDLDELVMDMLSKDPGVRPTAGEMLHRIESLVTRSPYKLENPASGMVRVVSSKQKRHPGRLLRWLAVPLVLLLLLAGWVEFAIYRRTEEVRLAQPQEISQELGVLSQTVTGLAGNLSQRLGQLLSAGGSADEPPPPPVAEEPIAISEPATLVLQPTATETASSPVATSTPSATGLPPTATPTPTPAAKIAGGDSVPSNKPPTSTPVKLVEPTQEPTAEPTATPYKKSTPVPDFTNTPVPPTATATATKVPATKPPPRPPTAKPPPAGGQPPPASGRVVQLVEPGSQGTGNVNSVVTFAWQPNFSLAPGQAFEVVFWRPWEDKYAAGLGVGTTTGNSLQVNFQGKEYIPPETYRWGVFLITLEPYQRLEYFGGDRNFVLSGN